MERLEKAERLESVREPRMARQAKAKVAQHGVVVIVGGGIMSGIPGAILGTMKSVCGGHLMTESISLTDTQRRGMGRSFDRRARGSLLNCGRRGLKGSKVVAVTALSD
jgi:hypothetical protein